LNKTGSRSIKIIIVLITLNLIFSLVGVAPVSAQQDDLPIYIVQSDDTISSIAVRFNVTPDEIIAVNGIIDPNFLKIGDQIKIPGLEGVSGTLTTQVVPFGASLTSLSRQNRLDENTLVKLNKYTSPAEAFAGIKMIIPVAEESQSLSPITNTNTDLSILELAAIYQTNPWVVKEFNSLAATWQVLPDELIYLESENPDEISLAIPHITNVKIDSLPLVQGDTIEFLIQSDVPVSIQAEINDKQLHFFSENPNEYISLYGVSAVAEPGAYPLTMQITTDSGETYRFEQWVLLKEAGFINDPEIYVPPDSVDPNLIAAEEAIFEGYISKYTPTRYWDAIFQPPVSDRTCITGYYGNRRSYNDGALLYYHTGIDFGYCTGIEVYAPARGVVVATEEDLTVRGNALIIDHGWGVFTGYWHLSEFSVSVGDIVEPGQLIASIGSTGRSAAPHLHFEMIVNGVAVNPETWLDEVFP